MRKKLLVRVDERRNGVHYSVRSHIVDRFAYDLCVDLAKDFLKVPRTDNTIDEIRLDIR